MGYSDYLACGDYNAICYVCGCKFKFSQLKRHWQGYYVCPQDWEPRQPQDFVHPVADNQTVPVAQPQAAPIFVPMCTSTCSVPGIAQPGCMIPGNNRLPSWYNPQPGS